ncbi:hypothetical protein CY34DRAFT_417439 [Suillus luteus UH-Slu-Lm8-n1]|uniref:Uncharacterized protein n=1 Tax=Suillus luteus UH-Slu-Lm8-n1 TaxID=930992 RepID=A0A0D0A8H8_9AGAM|nr:hypothetical protein CY34DRAFT_417439 [Suillus luteus UH-Slu-Lm8-n1]
MWGKSHVKLHPCLVNAASMSPSIDDCCVGLCITCFDLNPNASCQVRVQSNRCLVLHRKRDRHWSRATCSARVKHVHHDHINEPRGSGASLEVGSGQLFPTYVTSIEINAMFHQG